MMALPCAYSLEGSGLVVAVKRGVKVKARPVLITRCRASRTGTLVLASIRLKLQRESVRRAAPGVASQAGPMRSYNRPMLGASSPIITPPGRTSSPVCKVLSPRTSWR